MTPHSETEPRSSTFLKTIKSLAQQQHSDRAIQLVHALNIQQKAIPLHYLLDALIPERSFNKECLLMARKEALSIINPQDRERLLQRLVQAAARHGDLGLTFETALMIEDPEAKSYALSNAIQAFLSRESVSVALQILPAVTDHGARSDAINYFIKYFSLSNQFNEAEEFIYSLSSPIEKAEALHLLSQYLAAVKR